MYNHYTIELEDGSTIEGTACQISKILGVKYKQVNTRLRHGWTIEQAVGITPPPEKKIIRVPISMADEILKNSIEKKARLPKHRKLVFVHCSSSSGYYDWREK